ATIGGPHMNLEKAFSAAPMLSMHVPPMIVTPDTLPACGCRCQVPGLWRFAAQASVRQTLIQQLISGGGTLVSSRP
ncbi:MAG: hypothetical protein WD078_05770, partial [Woeseia sp.]